MRFRSHSDSYSKSGKKQKKPLPAWRTKPQLHWMLRIWLHKQERSHGRIGQEYKWIRRFLPWWRNRPQRIQGQASKRHTPSLRNLLQPHLEGQSKKPNLLPSAPNGFQKPTIQPRPKKRPLQPRTSLQNSISIQRMG